MELQVEMEELWNRFKGINHEVNDGKNVKSVYPTSLYFLSRRHRARQASGGKPCPSKSKTMPSVLDSTLK